MSFAPSLKVAVVGSGISGLSAAWLLAHRHHVTLFEAEDRLGGHSNTVDVGKLRVDTGFIVFNEQTYPNLSALLRHLDVATIPTEMSFSVSLDAGDFEYSGTGIIGLLAQPANVMNQRFWSMLLDIKRFYQEAPTDVAGLGDLSLAQYLEFRRYGADFRDRHLYPMAAAIWSTPACDVGAYPARAFIRFFENHGLLKLAGRPIWRTVGGGSRSYVERLMQDFPGRVERATPIVGIRRTGRDVELLDKAGRTETFDHVVVATHADQALALLADPTPDERETLGAFGYTPNEAVLHSDESLMPRRRRVWSSWNYLTGKSCGAPAPLSVSYWMNRLQSLDSDKQLFVTLNPLHQPAAAKVVRREHYSHPCFDALALAAQGELWSLQGVRRTWFCGAYFGAGFHEDGLQAGLAVAEELGGLRRPWRVADESGRIQMQQRRSAERARESLVQ